HAWDEGWAPWSLDPQPAGLRSAPQQAPHVQTARRSDLQCDGARPPSGWPRWEEETLADGDAHLSPPRLPAHPPQSVAAPLLGHAHHRIGGRRWRHRTEHRDRPVAPLPLLRTTLRPGTARRRAAGCRGHGPPHAAGVYGCGRDGPDYVTRRGWPRPG